MKSYQWWKKQKKRVQKKYTLLLGRYLSPKELVTPQPKTGHWIRVDENKLRCSECEVTHFIAQYPSGKIGWCPNCGAKMIEPQESEV